MDMGQSRNKTTRAGQKEKNLLGSRSRTKQKRPKTSAVQARPCVCQGKGEESAKKCMVVEGFRGKGATCSASNGEKRSCGWGPCR